MARSSTLPNFFCDSVLDYIASIFRLRPKEQVKQATRQASLAGSLWQDLVENFSNRFALITNGVRKFCGILIVEQVRQLGQLFWIVR